MRNNKARRRIEVALGLIWLLDGALQFQPYMFSKDFFAGILGMANMGLPGPVSTADYHVADLLVAHPVVWNSTFASLQVLIGAGLIWRRTARLALAVSIPWALGVWLIGEGFGGMFMGGTSLLTGAPGAALLYAVIALMIWPGRGGRWQERFGLGAWALVWCGSALLEFETVNHLAGVPGAQIVDGGYNQPSWLAALDRASGHLVGRNGTEFAVALGLAAALVGLGALWPATRRFALTGGIALGVAVGVVGQNLGSIATGEGTDPGTGPLLVLFAIALWTLTARVSDVAPAGAARAVDAPRTPLPVWALQSEGSAST